MGELDGETVVVTGASRGLGRSMSLRFAAEGANVALLARGRDDLEAVADEATGETLVVPTDVTESEPVRNAVEAVLETYGEPTCLVNNAGIGQLTLHDELRETVDVEETDWRTILDVNLTGVFLCAKHTLPPMLEAGRGNVINVSSGLGRRALPGWGPYVTSKWGLEGFTRTLAMEYEGTVNVNGLDPGGRVETAFWDHLPDEEREGVLSADVMDDAAVALAAQPPGGITGESLPAEEWEARFDAETS